MKRLLLTFLLSVATLILFSQTVKTRLSDANTSWNNPAAWSPAGNPATGDHIIIPAGVALDFNQNVTLGYVEVQSGATANIINSIVIQEASTFEDGSTVNWSSGTISGGATITNNGQLNLVSLNNKTLLGLTTLINTSELNITTGGDLFITDGIVINEVGAVLDMQADNGNISYSGVNSHVLNNFGTIKKTLSTGEAQINTDFTNTGTISVESGILSLQLSTSKEFTGGVYNVWEGATFDWDAPLSISGELTGVIEGALNWNSALTVSSSATFNFSEGSAVNWTTSNLTGGGTLLNAGMLNLTTNNNKTVLGDTQLQNTGEIYITTAGDLFITQGQVTNDSDGLIEMQAANGNISWSGGSVHVLNNFGLIRKIGEGEAQIHVELVNEQGTLSVEAGTLSFQNGIGKNLNGGTYNVSPNAVLDWDQLVTPMGTLSGVVNGTINLNSNVVIPEGEEAILDFSGAGDINWTTGIISGGGVLTNNGILNLTSNNNKVISGDSRLDNNGVVNLLNLGDLFISQGVVNNNVGGVIDMTSDNANISWSGGSSHILNNFGEIKRTTSEGEAQIVVELYNHPSGVINVENGTLSLQNAIGKYLDNGTYNVSEGAVFDWDATVTATGVIAGTIDGTINWNNVLEVPTDAQATFAFEGTGNFNWTTSSLNGGGTLVNQTTLNLVSNNNKIILGDTQFDNQGVLNITSVGDLFISQGVVNNMPSGVIDLQTANGNISWSGGTSHVLNNSGEIKRTSSEGEVQIYVQLFNSPDGVITVESGTLSFQDAIGKNFDGGTINVSEGAVLDWDGAILPTGTLEGTINGALNWNNTVSVPLDEEATFSFSGSGDFNWTGSSLNGGGTLINNSVLNLTGNSGKFIFNDSHLLNQSRMNIAGFGDLFISQGVVTNASEAIFDLQNDNGTLTYSGAGSHVFINEGLFIKSAGTSVSNNFVDFTNDGNLEIVEGTFRVIGTYLGSGIISGEGIMEPPVNTVFSGVVSSGLNEGADTGTLEYRTNYFSSTGASLEIDINGLTPDAEHDVFHIQGDAELNGGLDVNLGFIPEIGDEFIVLTTTGEITTCNLPSSETILSGVNNFIFIVNCQNDNQVVLELVAIGGNGDYNMDGAITISDLSGFLAEFGTLGEGLIGDFNGDGAVTSADLSSFLSVFGIVY